MDRFFAGVLLAAGLLNFLPLVGIAGAVWLQRLYDVGIADRDLLILMRHRAVLFGAMGLFIMAAAFVPAWQWPAFFMALLSMFSFVVLAAGCGNAALRKIVIVDVVASLLLVVAGLLRIFTA